MRQRFNKLRHFVFTRYPLQSGVLVLLLLLAYAFCLPRPLFDTPVCVVLEDREGQLLGARIAADGQWRFPQRDSLPARFARALVEFEDRRFYRHPGVDPIGLGRALVQNLRGRRVVSGGSTITMQVIRMARRNPPRNLWQKAIELVMSTRLEWSLGKDDILETYAANAPFGGNVVGLEAASWRYFGKQPKLLSWAEAAVLAVLPNSPALIHPGRNRKTLLDKRNRLLDRLHLVGVLDKTTWELSKEEPLPDAPLPLPQLAPHLLARAQKAYISTGKIKTARLRTTLDANLQRQVTELVAHHHSIMKGNGVNNAAALVIDVEKGQVLAYVGNAPDAGADYGEDVDIIRAARSTGSILKPFLYALALDEGVILPNSLLPDVPTVMGGYRPENFHEKFDGVVSARRSLIRSLNIPMVYLLQKYGLEKFHFQLRKMGFGTINRPPAHYGLPLVLGGAEATLWDICNAYAGASRMLTHVYEHNGLYDHLDTAPASYLLSEALPKTPKDALQKNPAHFGAAAAWHTFDAMQWVERPDAEGQWQNFRSSRRVAWKTGTSFGFRDAWAVGVTPRYVVGVWVGNASGEGRPGLVGVQASAPLLFSIFDQLPSEQKWFERPYDDMVRLPVCKTSGMRPLAYCPTDTVWAPAKGIEAPACPYHTQVHLDRTAQWQVSDECEDPALMVHRPWFVLPPLEEHYYKSKHPDYVPLPKFRSDCDAAKDTEMPMQLIYPRYPTRILVPVDLNGQMSRTVFAVAHRRPDTKIYWHLDDTYISTTSTFHSIELNPPAGAHTLTLVDEDGNRLSQRFTIIERSGQ